MGDILVIPTEMGSKTVESAASCYTFDEKRWFRECMEMQINKGITSRCSRTVDALNLQWSEGQIRNLHKLTVFSIYPQ